MTDDESRELTDFEEAFVEGWKDRWQGIDSYVSMLIYASFIFVGLGLGVLIMTRQVIYTAGEAPAGIGRVTKTWLAVSVAGFGSCHLLANVLAAKFG